MDFINLTEKPLFLIIAIFENLKNPFTTKLLVEKVQTNNYFKTLLHLYSV